ncbi:hypothetical protein [Sphingomonas faeni]|uniref:hypothetical protein n=1 Tax=Sphingomonas faeni TaxID=185950 RepID=UPI003347BECE
MTLPADSDRPVVMVTGAFPPDICGVGDYTGRLMASAPSSWQLLVERNWTLGAAIGILRRLLQRRPSIIIVQYPTQGYGWSLIPHLLVVFGKVTGWYRSVLALHEFTSLSGKARAVLAIASHFAAHIVFTTEVERDRARADWLFSSRVPTSIIGILSNIPWTISPPPFSDRDIDVAYFGHIRPNKGLENFLEVMAGVRRANGSTRIAVIGEIPKGFEAFGEMVAARCREIDCALILNLDDEAAGRRLADIKILYLPFRDGVSARRGSALAGLGNGALVASLIGDATPKSLLPAVVPCDGSEGDVQVLLRTLRYSNAEAAVLQRAGHTYIETMLPRDWAHVVAMYESVLAAASAKGGR